MNKSDLGTPKVSDITVFIPLADYDYNLNKLQMVQLNFH